MDNQQSFSYFNEIKEKAIVAKSSHLQFNLTSDQYLILQHYLPKKYFLQKNKLNKKNTFKSSLKLTPDDNQNFSRLSNTINSNEQVEGKQKRQKKKHQKKISRLLQNKIFQNKKKSPNPSKHFADLNKQMNKCYKILLKLKKHKSAHPFLQSVNSQDGGAQNYSNFIKEPMDFSIIQSNLKNREYQTQGQFHGDINKIWLNSYATNQKTSLLYKLTQEMEKYYKSILAQDGIYQKSKNLSNIVLSNFQQTKRQSLSASQENQRPPEIQQCDRKSVSASNQVRYRDSDSFLE